MNEFDIDDESTTAAMAGAAPDQTSAESELVTTADVTVADSSDEHSALPGSRTASATEAAADAVVATEESVNDQPTQVSLQRDRSEDPGLTAASDPVEAAGNPELESTAAESEQAAPVEAAAQLVVAETEPQPESLPADQGVTLPTQDPELDKPKRGRRAASRPAGPPTPVFSAAETPLTANEIVVRPSVASVAAVFIAPELPMVIEPAKPKRKKRTQGDDQPAEAADHQQVATEAESEASDPEANDDSEDGKSKRRRRRGGRGRGRRLETDSDSESGEESSERVDNQSAGDAKVNTEADTASPEDSLEAEEEDHDTDTEGGSSRRRRRRRRPKREMAEVAGDEDVAEIGPDEVTLIKGSTRLEAKKQRRRDGRVNRGVRAPILTEAEFLARRESVDRHMVVRRHHGITQIAVLEDSVLVEHYVGSESNSSMIGNVYLGRVQNVLPSMEAAFIDIGRGRNAVLYAGEVNWEAAGMEGQPKRIEKALKTGDSVLVQVTKDPVGQKGARLTSQISLPGRFLVYVPEGGVSGISRKLPDRERTRLKKILKRVVPDEAGVIVRTAAEGASEEQLRQDVERLAAQWENISQAASQRQAPALLRSEPDLAIKVARDIFNEDFREMTISGEGAYETLAQYIGEIAPDLVSRLTRWHQDNDVFATLRIDEQLAKALDRKVYLPSGGSLVIDRTEAMTVIDVNTGKFTGQGGNLEETVTKNNLEAAEEIVRQLRLRDIGGIIVVDFIDMVMENNRDLVLRRMVECLSRDRTKHQVAEVTSLGLVQMTRKRIGQGLLETFSENCDACKGRGVIVRMEPVGHTPVVEPRKQRSAPSRRLRVTGPIPGAPIEPKAGEEHLEAHPDPVDQVEADATVDNETNANVAEVTEVTEVTDEAGQSNNGDTDKPSPARGTRTEDAQQPRTRVDESTTQAHQDQNGSRAAQSPTTQGGKVMAPAPVVEAVTTLPPETATDAATGHILAADQAEAGASLHGAGRANTEGRGRRGRGNRRAQRGQGRPTPLTGNADGETNPVTPIVVVHRDPAESQPESAQPKPSASEGDSGENRRGQLHD